MTHVNQFTSRPQDFPAGDPTATGDGMRPLRSSSLHQHEAGWRKGCPVNLIEIAGFQSREYQKPRLRPRCSLHQLFSANRLFPDAANLLSALLHGVKAGPNLDENVHCRQRTGGPDARRRRGSDPARLYERGFARRHGRLSQQAHAKLEGQIVPATELRFARAFSQAK